MFISIKVSFVKNQTFMMKSKSLKSFYYMPILLLLSFNLIGQDLVDNHKLLQPDGRLVIDSLYKDLNSKLIIEKVVKPTYLAISAE